MENTVLILAGGLGTRLGKLTIKTPKSMIEINNEPFYTHQLNLLKNNGAKNIHFCLGHYSDILVRSIKKSKFYSNLNISFSFDGKKLLGTGGAIKNSLKYISDEFFVMYGDSYLDVNLNEMLQYFKKIKKNQEGLMTVFKNNKKFDTSNVIFRNN